MLRLLLCALLVSIGVSHALPRDDLHHGCTVPPTAEPDLGDSVERPCGTSVDKLWLDVIFAFDTSSSMGQTGLTQVVSTVYTALQDLTIGQGLVQQTRVGIVSYNANATIVAPLTEYRSTDDALAALYSIEPSSVERVNLLAALQASDEVLKKVPESRTRQVVFVLIASAYREEEADPVPLARQIKEAGHKLMTIAMKRNDEAEDEVVRILKLSSDGFGFRTDKDNGKMPKAIQAAFVQANCFCPNGWYQLTDSFNSPKKNYGECLRFASAAAGWFPASLSCPRLSQGRGFLASEFSPMKHDFNVNLVRKISGITVPYHIGLSYDAASGRYIWQEKYPNGTRIPLDNKYDPWIGGTENHAKDGDAVQAVPSGFFAYWQNINMYRKSSLYMCQLNACDTDNYCDDSVDSDD